MTEKQKGFHIVEVLGITFIVVLIVALAYMFFSNRQKAEQSSSATPTSNSDKKEAVMWAYDYDKLKWITPDGNAPACKDPLITMTPVDMSQVTAVGVPGAYRGFSYKPHGGFRAKTETGGRIDVKMPMDGYLTGITRYYESTPGNPYELQYLLSFENDCGIAFRFDHIHTLTPELQKLADKTPEPKKDDTRVDPNSKFEKVFMKAGDLVATHAGFLQAKNYGFDFGVYDNRERNKISFNSKWAAIHKQFSATTFHGICWIPLLPGNDAKLAEAMAKDRTNYDSSKPFYLISDYCDFAPYKTLDFNNGQPTNG